MQLVNHRVVGCVCVPLQSPSPSEHSLPWHPLLADGLDALFADLPLSSHWLEANATGAGGSPDSNPFDAFHLFLLINRSTRLTFT